MNAVAALKRHVAEVTLAEIATAAGVSRQALYLHFGSRAGLLTEMVRNRDAYSGDVRRMIKAIQHPEPRAAVEQFVRLWFRHVQSILPVARAMEASAPTDDAAQAALEDRMETLRQAIAKVVDRLVEAKLLADRWTPRQAIDWFWSRTHLDVWHHLAVDRRWDPDLVAERVAQSLWTDLVSDAPD